MHRKRSIASTAEAMFADLVYQHRQQTVQCAPQWRLERFPPETVWYPFSSIGDVFEHEKKLSKTLEGHHRDLEGKRMWRMEDIPGPKCTMNHGENATTTGRRRHEFIELQTPAPHLFQCLSLVWIDKVYSTTCRKESCPGPLVITHSRPFKEEAALIENLKTEIASRAIWMDNHNSNII